MLLAKVGEGNTKQQLEAEIISLKLALSGQQQENSLLNEDISQQKIEMNSLVLELKSALAENERLKSELDLKRKELTAVRDESTSRRFDEDRDNSRYEAKYLEAMNEVKRLELLVSQYLIKCLITFYFSMMVDVIF
jgi:septal ring factor EnvC (AmiA/AmiB activator)